MKQKIVIIDYGVGNTHSVLNAITRLGFSVKISDKENLISAADALVLPGVGAFDEAMKNLQARHLHEILNEQVLVNNKPILGICLGMQMFASFSEENGEHAGLGWIEGRVRLIDSQKGLRVPHVGWNDIKVNLKDPIFTRCPEESNFYFDHSYHYECASEHVAAFCNYGGKVTAAVQRKNIAGVQFHPEKSQNNGLRLFKGFFNTI